MPTQTPALPAPERSASTAADRASPRDAAQPLAVFPEQRPVSRDAVDCKDLHISENDFSVASQCPAVECKEMQSLQGDPRLTEDAGRAARRDVVQRSPFSKKSAAPIDVESASPRSPETVGRDAFTARDASPKQDPAPARDALSTSRDVARGQAPIEAARKDEGAESLRAVASQALSDSQYPSFLVSSPLVEPEAKPATGIDDYLHRRELFSRLTEQQKTAIDLILSGKKFEAIAAQLGIHRGTLWRWRRTDMDFRHALAMARDNAMEHACYCKTSSVRFRNRTSVAPPE